MIKRKKMQQEPIYNWLNIIGVIIFAILLYALVWAMCRGFDIGFTNI